MSRITAFLGRRGGLFWMFAVVVGWMLLGFAYEGLHMGLEALGLVDPPPTSVGVPSPEYDGPPGEGYDRYTCC